MTVNPDDEKSDEPIPELIIGLVGGIGTKLDVLVNELKDNFRRFKFEIVEISLSDIFDIYNLESLGMDNSIKEKLKGNKVERLQAKIDIGNKIREKTKSKSILAWLAIATINVVREGIQKKKPRGIVYIINQLKNPEEFKILRIVYSRSFLLIGSFEDVTKRKNRLLEGKSDSGKENEIEKLIRKDFDQKLDFGQNVSELFPESHLFVDVGNVADMNQQVKRFVNILFNYQFHTPSIDESCMFLAKGLSGTSADLSRQIGAVIADESGDIISTGCNDVPKFGGGLYWENDNPDLRDFKLDEDPNKSLIKKKIERSLTNAYEYLQCKINMGESETERCLKFNFENNDVEFTSKIDSSIKSLKAAKLEDIKRFVDYLGIALTKTDLGASLEFSRCLHAEMAAICDAARHGCSLKDKIMYSTTFPCHICAKHILAVGIKRVVYIDPYPKSEAKELFPYSIAINHDEYGQNKLVFEPFKGIAPRRYLHLFVRREKDDRKFPNGKVKPWPEGNQNLIIHLRKRFPSTYLAKEYTIIEKLSKKIDAMIDAKYKAEDSKNKNDFNRYNIGSLLISAITNKKTAKDYINENIEKITSYLNKEIPDE